MIPLRLLGTYVGPEVRRYRVMTALPVTANDTGLGMPDGPAGGTLASLLYLTWTSGAAGPTSAGSPPRCQVPTLTSLTPELPRLPASWATTPPESVPGDAITSVEPKSRMQT